MKNLPAILLSAAVAAALWATGHDSAQAAQTRGNWSTARRNPPPRRATTPPRRQFNFFGIFDARPGRANPYADRDMPRGAPRILATPPREKPKIYNYTPPPLVALSASRPAGSPDGIGLPQQIFDVLRNGQARFMVTPQQRKAILQFYAKRGYRPVWTTPYGPSPKTFATLEKLAKAHEEGLENRDYRIPVIWEANGDLQTLQNNLPALARLDVELTAAALRYAADASGGVVNPNKLSAYHDLKPPRVPAATILRKLAGSASPADWLDSLHPYHPAYRKMRAELKRLSGGHHEEPLPPVASGPLIRPGGYDTRIPLIRKHLIRLGFLSRDARQMVRAEPVSDTVGQPLQNQPPAPQPATRPPAAEDTAPQASADDENIYGEELERAVRKFQRKSGLKPDGIIGRGTLRALNRRRGISKAARIRKIRLNMERMRWMPRDFGAEHFLAIQPAYTLYYVKNGNIAWKTRIIIGKPTHQTSFFSDQMETIVFNPYWGVPQSIITKEMLPKLLRNPGWLDQEGYEITDKRGRRISSYNIDWGLYAGSRRVPFDVRQPPGNGNALGRVKFLFPNKHSIYMHDTPSRSLFKRRKRAFSHGCVRVQDPLRMAELVSGFDPRTIETKIQIGKNERLPLSRKIPVHLAYFTVWPDESGKLRFYNDVYGRDRLLDTALRKTARARAQENG